MQELSLFRNLYISAKLWLSIIVLVLVASVLTVDEHSAYADQTPPTLPQSSNPQPELPEKPTLPGTAHTTKATVAVRYVDQQGKGLHTDVILHGEIGDPYKADAVAIAGYMLYDVPNNVKGIFLEQPQTVTYVYQTETVPDNDVGTVVTSGAGVVATGSGLSPAKEQPVSSIRAAPPQPAKRKKVPRVPVRAGRGQSVVKRTQQASSPQRPAYKRKQSAATQHHGGVAAKVPAPKHTAFHKQTTWLLFLLWWIIGGIVIGFWFFLAYRRRRKEQEE